MRDATIVAGRLHTVMGAQRIIAPGQILTHILGEITERGREAVAAMLEGRTAERLSLIVAQQWANGGRYESLLDARPPHQPRARYHSPLSPEKSATTANGLKSHLDRLNRLLQFLECRHMFAWHHLPAGFHAHLRRVPVQVRHQHRANHFQVLRFLLDDPLHAR